MLPPQPMASSTREAFLLLINTVPEPALMLRGWGGQLPQACSSTASPCRAAGRWLISTSGLPAIMGVGGKQPWPLPMSPSRAAFGPAPLALLSLRASSCAVSLRKHGTQTSSLIVPPGGRRLWAGWALAVDPASALWVPCRSRGCRQS